MMQLNDEELRAEELRKLGTCGTKKASRASRQHQHQTSLLKDAVRKHPRVLLGTIILGSFCAAATYFGAWEDIGFDLSFGRPSTKPAAGFVMPSFGVEHVTYSEYSQIRDGMSYREVVAIIGSNGEEMSRGRMEGVPGVMDPVVTIMYQWVNDNGSNMNAMFQNDKLVQKAQGGLR